MPGATSSQRSADRPLFQVDDGRLAQQVAAGDCPAFEELMRRYNRRLYRLARAVLRNDADAEDALQDAYLTAFRAMASFRGEASLSTWLARLVLNQCFTRQRRNARRDNIAPMVSTAAILDFEQNTMDTDQTSSPDRELMRTELRALLERKLDALPEVFRVVFVLRGVEELSVEETAQYLGIPEATVRTRHFRARSMLRESLAQEIDLAERDVFSFDGARCDRIVAGVLARIADAAGA